MKDHIKSKIFKFLLLTFGISWLCWGTIIIANKFGHLLFGSPMSMILYVIGGNGAPIASYILLKKWGEISGVKDFLKRHFKFKSPLKNYIMVISLLLVHFMIPIALASTNRTLPIYFGLFMIPLNFIGGGFEEIGWRGILQPYLESVLSFIQSTLIVSVIWSIWHLPLWFIAGTYQSTISFMMFSVAVVGMSFSLAVVRKTTENVFLCILLHSCMNSFLLIFMLKQNYSTIITMAVEIILALVVIRVISHDKKRMKRG